MIKTKLIDSLIKLNNTSKCSNLVLRQTSRRLDTAAFRTVSQGPWLQDCGPLTLLWLFAPMLPFLCIRKVNCLSIGSGWIPVTRRLVMTGWPVSLTIFGNPTHRLASGFRSDQLTTLCTSWWTICHCCVSTYQGTWEICIVGFGLFD